MKSLVFLGFALLLVFVAPLKAQEWQMAPADQKQWLETFRIVAPAETWKISVVKNDFIVETTAPVNVAIQWPNQSATAKPSSLVLPTTLRVTFRFSPRLTREEWQQRANTNEEIRQKHRLLLRQAGANQKFDEYWLSGPNAKERAAKYRAAALKLPPLQKMPPFFSLEHSVEVFQSWTQFGTVQDEDTRETLDELRRLFGCYEPHMAQGSWWAISEKTKDVAAFPVDLEVIGSN